MKTVRCSSLPLLFACPSALDDDLLIEHRFEASTVGSAVHEAMREVVGGFPPDLDALALRWACDRDELGRLVWAGRQAWEALAPSFPDAETEIETAAPIRDWLTLTGHIDVAAIVGDEARIGDFKSGRLDSDHGHQLLGYATCLLTEHRDLSRVVVTVIWLRSQEVETRTFTRADVEAWSGRLVDAVAGAGRRYVVGSHCEHCPRSHSCAAVQAKARESVALLQREEWATDAMARTLEGLAPAERVGLYRQAKLVASLAESAMSAVRLNVIQNGGELDAGDGKVLRIVEENGRRTIDTEKAWPILERHLDDGAEIASVVDVSASRLDALVAKKAGRGNGKSAKEALAAELAAAGAVKQSTIQKLVERRKEPTT